MLSRCASAICCVFLAMGSHSLLGQTTASQLPGLRLSASPDNAATADLDDALSRIAAARQALRSNPNSAREYVSLGRALKSTGENKAATEGFERARELDRKL